MTTTALTFPDFKTTGFYYYEVLEDLIRYKRIYLPELTDEDPHEPTIQLYRSFALSTHLNSVDIDLWAKESFFTTAELRSSVDAQLHLVDDSLAQATPASCDLLVRFTRDFPSAIETVPARSVFATEATAAVEAIEFENLDSVTTEPSDELSTVWGVESGTATDYTTEANASTDWDPWSTPAIGDAVYFGHDDLFTNRLQILVYAGGSDLTGVWEFYDGDWYDTTPDSVTNLGSTLELVVDGLFDDPGASREAAVVRVTLNETGAYEDIVSTYSGGENKVETSDFLGQTSPSTDATDYTVGVLWHELDITDDTILDFDFTGTKYIEFNEPWSESRLWQSGTITDTTLGDVTSNWIRYRIVAVAGSPTSPTLRRSRIDSESDLYQLITIYQGRTRDDDSLGTSDGSADQQFTVTRYPVIDDSTLAYAVAGTDWERQDNLLSSDALAEHYEVDFDDEGKATGIFGDGENGKIPPAASDISAQYRTMKEGQNGNVGSNKITINRSGVGWFGAVRNPRAATGWAIREGSTAADLAKAKRTHPAQLRALDRGVTASDIEALVADWYDEASGSRPVARCKAIEEGFGVKTVEAVCVANGGGSISPSVLADIDEYFNGVTGDPSSHGRILLNTELTATNYTQKTIDVTASVTGGTQAAIETALQGYLDPEALDDDGLDYRWEFGDTIYISALIALIFKVEGVENVTITVPASDVTLSSRELPKAGTLTITVT